MSTTENYTTQARALIVTPDERRLITPVGNRTTFTTDIDASDDTELFRQVEKNLEANFSLPKFKTRRALGKIGNTETFLLSTYHNKKLPNHRETFATRERELGDIQLGMNTHAHLFDPTDIEIMNAYANFIQSTRANRAHAS